MPKTEKEQAKESCTCTTLEGARSCPVHMTKLQRKQATEFHKAYNDPKKEEKNIELRGD